MRLFVIILTAFILSNCTADKEPVLSENSLLKFAGDIEYHIHMLDGSIFHHLFNMDDIYYPIVRSVPDLKNYSGFRAQLNTQVLNIGKELGQLVDMEDGRYDFLKISSMEDGQAKLLFRMSSTSGIVYHEYYIKVIEEELKVSDIRFVLTDEVLGEKLKSNILLSLTSTPGHSEWKNKYDNLNMKSLKIRREVEQLISLGDFEGAKKKFETIDKEVTKGKIFQETKINLAMASRDDKAYIDAYNELKSLFPNDALTKLCGWSFYQMTANYDSCYQMLLDLNEIVGEDPALDLLKADILMSKGMLDDATTLTANAQHKLVGVCNAYRTYLFRILESKDYHKTVEEMDLIVEKNSTLKYDMMRWFIEEEEFTASKYFLSWKERNGLS